VFVELPAEDSTTTDCRCLPRAAVEAAIQGMKNEVNNITAQEAAGQTGVDALYELCFRISNDESFSRDWN